MLTKIYIHNYKCFQNFTFDFGEFHEGVIIGQNGTGKTTLSCVLDVLRQIGVGKASVEALIGTRDFWHISSTEMLRIEASFNVGDDCLTYGFALELPEGFTKLRVAEETLIANGETILTRDRAQVDVLNRSGNHSHFMNDWHEFVLPRIFIQDGVTADAVKKIRTILSNILILRPIPDDMGRGLLADAEQHLSPRCENFDTWLWQRYIELPDIYEHIKQWLRNTNSLQDFVGFKTTGSDLIARFRGDGKSLEIPFGWLSSGEKIFFLAASIMAINEYGDNPVICFWDEPNNYLSLSEIGHVMISLRHSFSSRGQLIITTHSDEALSRFSDENVFYLARHSHLEPTLPMQSIAQCRASKGLVGEKEDLLFTNSLEG